MNIMQDGKEIAKKQDKKQEKEKWRGGERELTFLSPDFLQCTTNSTTPSSSSTSTNFGVIKNMLLSPSSRIVIEIALMKKAKR